MTIYDKIIEQINKLIDDFTIENDIIAKKLNITTGNITSNENNLILKSEMAYELGGGLKNAISGIAFSDNSMTEDEILLIGPDLDKIKEDISYARITILDVDDSEWKDNAKAYSSLRNITYTRYHVFPKGYMMRISTSAHKEPVRIGKKEIRKGLDFSYAGSCFIEGYHKNKDVKRVKVIFITDERFPYDRLLELAKKSMDITQSLNHIFDNLKMDCTICSMKKICDEVEGLKKVHMEQNGKRQIQ